jgi:two-component system nitrogen regulation response regulator GlnG
VRSVLYLGCPAAERPKSQQELASAHLSVVWADTMASALSELQRREMPVLLDLSKGAAALQIAHELRHQRSSTLVFAVVDARRPDLTTEAVLAGLADVIARPLGGRRVAHAIERELGYQSRQVHPMEQSGEDLYSHSPLMQDLMAIVARASATRAGVLITGEEGTGRQVVARAIHSAHAEGTDGTFVRVDCAAGDGDELEFDLFGVVARTSAGPDGCGLERISCGSRLQESAGGTLYLQNLTEAPARVQARLARVLRDREAVISDDGTPIDLDIRPMAGVDPTFDVAVHEGRVRPDLFRRLSAIRIDMPPLCSRREDIPALANYFVRDICAAMRVPPKTLSRPALSLISGLP